MSLDSPSIRTIIIPLTVDTLIVVTPNHTNTFNTNPISCHKVADSGELPNWNLS